MSNRNPDHVPLSVVSICISVFLSFTACHPPSNPSNPPSVSVILSRLETASNRIRDFKGSADVVASLNDHRGRVSTRIRYLAPDQYRLDIQGGFMQIIAVLFIDDQHVMLYTPQENTLFEGTLHDQDVVVPGLQIPLADIRTAVIGLANLQPYLEGPISEYRYENGLAVLSVRQSDRIRTIWIDPQKSVVLKEEVREGLDGASVTRTFEQYNRRKGIWRPGRVRILSGIKEESMDLIYHTQSVNEGLTGTDLTFHFPESVIRRPLQEMMPSVD